MSQAIDWFARLVLALCLVGAPLVGVIAPVVSALRLRRGSHRPSAFAVVAALIVWIALCAGVAMLLIQIGFAYAWEAAHAQRDTGGPLPLSEHLRLGGLSILAILALAGCAAIFHRLLAPPLRRGRFGSVATLMLVVLYNDVITNLVRRG